MSVVFFKDAVDTFECDVHIEGASTSDSKSRLILEFKDRTLLFNGSIENGHVSIKIPRLSEISDTQGVAILEVIAEQTYFEAWTSPFDLKNKKTVAIAEVKINDSSSKVIRIENISKEESSDAPILKENGIYAKTCSGKNKEFVSESFSRFKKLNKNEKRIIKESLKSFTPKPTIKTWAQTVFSDVETPYAKYCMYEVQKGMFNKKR